MNRLIDDFTRPTLSSALDTQWRAVTDRVMGGVSTGFIARVAIGGRPCLRLTGDVSTANNGGFVQAALDLDPDGGVLDAAAFTGIRIVVRGNGEAYGLHLKTTETTRPWQSYRARFVADSDWQEVHLPFDAFTPHRIDAPLDPARLRRLGLVAIGHDFHADVALSEIGFYAS